MNSQTSNKPIVTKNIQKYFIDVYNENKGQDFLKSLKLNYKSAINLCEQFILSCVWKQPAKPPPKNQLLITNCPELNYAKIKIRKLIEKYKCEVSDHIDRRKAEILCLYDYCKKAYENLEISQHKMINISLIPPRLDANLFVSFELVNRINILNYFINDKSALQEFAPYTIPKKQIVDMLNTLWGLRDKKTNWFPRSAITERLELAFSTQKLSFDAKSKTAFIKSIFNNAKKLENTLGYNPDNFFAIYLTLYRYAFDIYQHRFKPNGSIIKQFRSLHIDHFKALCDESVKIYNKAQEYLFNSMFECNPIDIFYGISLISESIVKICKIEAKNQNKDIPTFISFDKTIVFWHKLIIDTDFTYCSFINEYLEEYASDKSLSDYTRCSFEAFKVCVDDLVKSSTLA